MMQICTCNTVAADFEICRCPVHGLKPETTMSVGSDAKYTIWKSAKEPTLTDLLLTETATIDRLFLELSQFTTARTLREKQLDELLYAVVRKFKDETRFETALRYIRQAEREANEGTTIQEVVPNI